MFILVDGKPIFYIGKINGIGYTNEEEKNDIIERLKEENPDVEIKDEKVDIDRDLKEKAIELGKLQLTYSKSEFMQYLNGKKPIPEATISKLEEENILQEKAIMEMALVNEERVIDLELALSELTNILGEVL